MSAALGLSRGGSYSKHQLPRQGTATGPSRRTRSKELELQPRLRLQVDESARSAFMCPPLFHEIFRNRHIEEAITARSYATGPLRPTTAKLSECGRVDGACPRVRGTPSSSLRNEPSGRVEYLFLRLRANEGGIECRFGKSPLLLSEPAQVHVAIFAEGQCRERASYNADWLAADELDNQAGHAHCSIRSKVVSARR